MNDVLIVPTEFESEGEMIRGNFVVPSKGCISKGICKFHGLPGSPDQVRGIASDLARLGFTVLTFDFRGFRKSEGIFSLRGEIEDARNAITHLLDSKYTTESRVLVYGASFGGAIAVCSAARDERIFGVCLRAPLFDMEQYIQNPDLIPAIFRYMEHEEYGVIHGIHDERIRDKMIQELMSDAPKFNPMKDIKRIAPRPLLITTGTDDQLIDIEGVRNLYRNAGEPKELRIIEGGDHVLSTQKAKNETRDIVTKWFSQFRLME
ncbi:MAG: hypothetical protein BAJATHORv1_30103 [Candidatus Thorarchaeota archaeon]|nr:MAG: hypothetical protein BAJATHORv1_30103 [Candidatus Thorarchaeota archaeon]